MSCTIRAYRKTDLPAVRSIFGDDEFARPRLLCKYPRMAEYLADEVSCYFTRYEPESIVVAEENGEVVGVLLGAINAHRYEEYHQRYIQPHLVRRCLSGAYGIPVWMIAMLRTHWAGRNLTPPTVDHDQYPAQLHIGIQPAARRKGMGTGLMDHFARYLREKNVAGYHLYVSSFHPLGLAFYRKLGLDDLGKFTWRFHDGYDWLDVTEYIFGMKIISRPGR